MLLRPSMGTYYSLLQLAGRGVFFDDTLLQHKSGSYYSANICKGVDQGFWNSYSKKWDRSHLISFIYNCTPSGHYQWVSSAALLRGAVANLLLVDTPPHSHTTGQISH